jgi:hypothetical protein
MILVWALLLGGSVAESAAGNIAYALVLAVFAAVVLVAHLWAHWGDR